MEPTQFESSLGRNGCFSFFFLPRLCGELVKGVNLHKSKVFEFHTESNQGLLFFCPKNECTVCSSEKDVPINSLTKTSWRNSGLVVERLVAFTKKNPRKVQLFIESPIRDIMFLSYVLLFVNNYAFSQLRSKRSRIFRGLSAFMLTSRFRTRVLKLE